jgi:hypothetical protein
MFATTARLYSPEVREWCPVVVYGRSKTSLRKLSTCYARSVIRLRTTSSDRHNQWLRREGRAAWSLWQHNRWYHTTPALFCRTSSWDTVPAVMAERWAASSFKMAELFGWMLKWSERSVSQSQSNPPAANWLTLKMEAVHWPKRKKQMLYYMMH